jgi:hypothetical protein
LLGDERFFAYLELAEGSFGQINRLFAGQPEMAPVTRYQLYALHSEFSAELVRLSKVNDVEKRLSETRAKAQAIDARMRAVLSPAAIATYQNHSLGRSLRSFLTTPTAPNTP